MPRRYAAQLCCQAVCRAAVLPRRHTAEMNPVTRYKLGRNSASMMTYNGDCSKFSTHLIATAGSSAAVCACDNGDDEFNRSKDGETNMQAIHDRRLQHRFKNIAFNSSSTLKGHREY